MLSALSLTHLDAERVTKMSLPYLISKPVPKGGGTDLTPSE